jgi:predicted nucleic acid-binding protein
MMLVVDASVLVAATCDSGPEGAWAEAILESGDLAAPHLAPAEAANVLRRLEQSKHLTRLEATAAQKDLSQLEIDLLPYEPFAERVWELRANLTTYDAWYVAIAESAGLPLATLDHKLARAAGPTCRFLIPG